MSYSKRGFWILSTGEIKEIDGQHISAVIKEPELFGETLSEIEEIHNYYGEPLHTEKKGRDTIMSRLVFCSSALRVIPFMRHPEFLNNLPWYYVRPEVAFW